MKTGLVLVDIQNDYFPGGSMELVSMESAADALDYGLLRYTRAAKTPVDGSAINLGAVLAWRAARVRSPRRRPRFVPPRRRFGCN